MRIEIDSYGNSSLFIKKDEWERLGNSSGWNTRLVKEASAPSLKIEGKTGEKYLSMNKGGWVHLGKIAGFIDDDESDFDEFSLHGEGEEYEDRQEDEENDENYLNMLEDVEVDDEEDFSDEFEEEAIRETIEAVRTTMEGIDTGQAPQHLVPELIISSLEPISEYRNIDMMGDAEKSVRDYLEKRESPNDAEIRRLVRIALVKAGYEIQ